MWVSVVGVRVAAWLSPLACVTARGKCFARVYEIKPDGLPLKSRIFPSRPLVQGEVSIHKRHTRSHKISQKNSKTRPPCVDRVVSPSAPIATGSRNQWSFMLLGSAQPSTSTALWPRPLSRRESSLGDGPTLPSA